MRKINMAIKWLGETELRCRLATKFTIKHNDCWLWHGAKTQKGYGYIMLDFTSILAHRIMYVLHFGIIPDGMCICHKCDVGNCVNPKHFFLGTKKDNAQDAEIKGRLVHHRGSSHGNSKLKEDQVKIIKQMILNGENQAFAARMFGVTRTTITDIKIGKTWRHIAI